MMRKFEYRRESIGVADSVDDAVSLFNVWGSKGWEVFSISPKPYHDLIEGDQRLVIWLKREIG